ncbi:hypothetical protein G6F55_008858 [Rhizopus delemar]|uniref:U3 small nucleolar RNA-associated protein 6 n=2 Tax=Rhizopus TaxID=4842 RepID=A0A9P6YW77_9FUNG|nr:hypothetical protein G6F55_008858 [Rhizopus delemar]KAG1545582.1 hypothetical protein G6F51_005379 [Rhizopus arrhizus]KAG1498509.1 hypothetical protein G6F54_005033 [Rhizopus delemar]KAG1506541.1 hypothetical protein G6F53_009614 [Rhizopus delemar]KAG1558844.1 hypothetical protein G6F49_004141 [Rhizopus delemar]
MAESVQYQLERMLPELEALEHKKIFTPVEIKSIIKKRTNFEYALHRRIKQKIDFLRSIEYEMNLEELRKKRMKRLGLILDPKEKNLEFSGIKRIYGLFKRATKKFTGDITLWLQYIDFAKKNDSSNVLSGIFVQAIQYHPMNASLWIMAASWENEHNSNIAAARTLMQRAIRLMPENELLWHEYFRLELIYIEKIKLRRRILGIDEEADEKKDIDAMQVDVSEEDNIQLPTVTGEEYDAWKEEQGEEKKLKLSEEEAKTLEEANNPILNGLLTKIIYDNAIQAISQKIEFRKKFIDIYREFTNTEKHIDYIYETIRRDMNQVPAARAYLSERHLFVARDEGKDECGDYISVSDPAFIPALRKCVEEYEGALNDLPGSEMSEHYIRFILNWYTIAGEENLKLYLTKLAQRTFKACEKKNSLSKKLYEDWAQFIMNQKDFEKAKNVVEKGLKAHKDSSLLWSCKIQLSDTDAQSSIYAQGLEANPESLLLWTSYKDWIFDQCEKKMLSTEEIDSLFSKACDRVTMLLPSMTAESADRNEIRILIQSSYVEWASKTGGIEFARSVYKKILKNSYPTYQFIMRCLEIENQLGDAETGPEHVEPLFEKLIGLDSADKEEPYITYLSYLYSQNKLQKANQVYNRACKEVANKESFDVKVKGLIQKK